MDPTRPAVSGTLYAQTTAVKEHVGGPDQQDDTSQRRHDGIRRAPSRSGRDAAATSCGCPTTRPRRLSMKRSIIAWPPELFSDRG
jgi:hypothetical protein